MIGVPRLSLGPVPYLWPRAVLFKFYERIASTPVDIVYLGETTCSQRRELKPDAWNDPPAELAAALSELVRTDPDPGGVPTEYKAGIKLDAPKVAPDVSAEDLDRLRELGYVE